MIWVIIILFLLFLILWGVGSSLKCHEKYPFDQYEQLKYYKECPYNKEQCIDILNKSRLTPSKYKAGEICIVTVSIGERKFSKVTKRRMEKYCQLYNYHFEYFTEVLDDKYPLIWQKCVAMDRVLNLNYKVVVWFDDDIYMTNMNYRIEDFLNLTPNDIFMPRDIIKNNYNHYINSGCYMMKNNNISKEFMKDTLCGMKGLFNGHFETAINHEQSINTYLYFSQKKYADAIEVLPYGVLQSVHNKHYYLYKNLYYFVSNFLEINEPWQEGDYCIHFITLKEDERNDLCHKIEKYDNNDLIPFTKKEWYTY